MEQENQPGARTRSRFVRSSSIAVAAVALLSIVGIGGGIAAAAQECSTSHQCWDPPYPNMPDIAPPMVRDDEGSNSRDDRDGEKTRLRSRELLDGSVEQC